MGDSTVGQQSEDNSDEDAFLSPEEADTILTALEEMDNKVLETAPHPSPDEEGVFISPEDIEGGGGDEAAEEPLLSAPPPQGLRGADPARAGDAEQPELLSRIAAELRSIKSEIGTLKNTYDDMISKASSMSAADSAREGFSGMAPSGGTEAAGLVMPENIASGLKKLLGYLDRLLESLPEEKIDEFARSEYFELYRKVFEFFDLV